MSTTFEQTRRLFDVANDTSQRTTPSPRSVLQPLSIGNIQYATNIIPRLKTPNLSPQYGQDLAIPAWNDSLEGLDACLAYDATSPFWSLQSLSTPVTLPYHFTSPLPTLSLMTEVELAAPATPHESVSASAYSHQPSPDCAPSSSKKRSCKKVFRSCDSCLAAMKGAPLSAYSMNVQVLNAKEVRAASKFSSQALFQQKKKEQKHYCKSEATQRCLCKFFRVRSCKSC